MSPKKKSYDSCSAYSKNQECVIDYYSILGVERFSPIEVIAKAYHSKINKWHPDRVANAAKELQVAAKKQTELLITAYKTLSDHSLKPGYDQSLKEADPRLISKDGIPIEMIGRRALDVGRMVAGKPWELGKQLLARARAMTGYNEETFKLIQEGYDNSKKPSPAIREAYFHALTIKNAYLAIVEDTTWADAGVIHQPEPSLPTNPAGYLEQRVAQIEEAKELIGSSICQYVKQVGSDKLNLLLPSSTNSRSENLPASPLEISKELTSYALNGFSKQRSAIIKAAKERVEVLKELIRFTDFEYYPKGQKRSNKVEILLSIDERVEMSLGFELQEDVVKNIPIKKPSLDGWLITKVTSPKYRQTIDKRLSDSNLIILYSNKDISPNLEIGFILDQHFKIKKGQNIR